MSQRGRRSQASQPELQSDDSDEDYIQPASQSNALSSTEETALAGQVCNLLLSGEIKKVPVKKAVIRKFVLKKHKRCLSSVMTRAQHMMKHVFGYKIVTTKDSYILVNTLNSKLVRHQDLSEAELSVNGLLAAILMAVFMSEGKISAGALETYLRTLDVDMATTAKPMIQEFSRKKYLEIVSETSSDPPAVMYKWGERAHAEFCKKEMLELICKVYGNNMKPSQWTYQWNIIQEEVKKDAAGVA